MQKDMILSARILENIEARLQVQADPYLSALRASILQWHSELYRCHILEAPRDVLSYIFTFFKPTQVWKLRCVCRAFKSAAESDVVWREFCESYIDTTDPSKYAVLKNV